MMMSEDLEKQILTVDRAVLVQITELKMDVKNLKEVVATLVTKERFTPVAYIAYGLAGGVLTTFLGAVIAQVIIQP
jgi:hypothetical protein